jgi:hypothetical protein
LFIAHFFLWGGVSLPRGLCWFISGVTGEIPCDAWCSPVGLPNFSQAGFESASGSVAALLSQYNVVWKNFPWARGSGCQSFDSPC